MATPISLKYRAFLSYSHADSRVAKWLHGRLERFDIGRDLVGRNTSAGPIPRTLRPIFRDREEFTPGFQLAEQTQVALDNSQSLIVLCSPSAARSRPVNDEVELFKARWPARPVIPVIVAGEPNCDIEDCVPAAIGAPVLAADLRDSGDGRELGVAKIVARLVGLATEEVFRREQRAQRRKQRFWIVGLSSVAILLSGLTFWAEFNRREADRQRAVAEEQRVRAQTALDAGTETATEIVLNFAQQFRMLNGVPPALIQDVLNRVITLQDKLASAGEPSPDLRYSQAIALLESANTLLAIGDAKGAMNSATKGLSLIAALNVQFPDSPDDRRALMTAELNVGDISLAQHKLDDALPHYRRALQIAKALTALDGKNRLWQRDLEAADERVGDILLRQGQQDEAQQDYSEAYGIASRFLEREPNNVLLLRDFMVASENMGDALRAQGKIDDALRYYHAGYGLAKRLVTENGMPQWKIDLARTGKEIAGILTAKGRPDEALPYYQDAISALKQTAVLDQTNTQVQSDIVSNAQAAGDVFMQQKKFGEALASFNDALAAAKSLSNLNASGSAPNESGLLAKGRVALVDGRIADALIALGRVDEARPPLHEAHDIFLSLVREQPDNPDVLWLLCLAKYRLAVINDDANKHWNEIVEILTRLRDRGQLKPEWAKMLNDAVNARAKVGRQ